MTTEQQLREALESIEHKTNALAQMAADDFPDAHTVITMCQQIDEQAKAALALPAQRPDAEGVDEYAGRYKDADLSIEKIRNMWLAHEDGVYCLQSRTNLGAIVGFLLDAIARQHTGAGAGTHEDVQERKELMRLDIAKLLETQTYIYNSHALSLRLADILEKYLITASPAPAVPVQTAIPRDNNATGNGDSMGCGETGRAAPPMRAVGESWRDMERMPSGEPKSLLMNATESPWHPHPDTKEP